jgi:hypothetical protein
MAYFFRKSLKLLSLLIAFYLPGCANTPRPEPESVPTQEEEEQRDLPAYKRPDPAIPGDDEKSIVGGLDKTVIDEVVRKHVRPISKCYTDELDKGAKIKGRVATNFLIGPDGKVKRANSIRKIFAFRENERPKPVKAPKGVLLINAKVENCVLGVIKGMRFPEPLGGGTVEVDYPFNFTPAD